MTNYNVTFNVKSINYTGHACVCTSHLNTIKDVFDIEIALGHEVPEMSMSTTNDTCQACSDKRIDHALTQCINNY